VPLLIPILEGRDRQARLLAISALGQLGATDVLTPLLEAPSTDATTRAFVQEALRPVSVPSLLSTTAGLK
jgi:HEAT repeat protein